MIAENDKEIILHYAKKYSASSIILFGSSLEKDTEANDIDLGVKGIEPWLFFKLYAELLKHQPSLFTLSISLRNRYLMI